MMVRMPTRILMIGALTAVVITAVIVNLSVLDIISVGELRDALGRSLLVVAVSTLAIAVTAAILKSGRRRSDPPHESQS